MAGQCSDEFPADHEHWTVSLDPVPDNDRRANGIRETCWAATIATATHNGEEDEPDLLCAGVDR